MRTIKRVISLTGDIGVEGKKVYSINDRGCLTIRVEESADRDVLVLLTASETEQLKRFLRRLDSPTLTACFR